MDKKALKSKIRNYIKQNLAKVMNEERVTQTSIGNTDIDKLNRRLKNDPHAMVDIAYGGNIPDRSLEDKNAHHEQSVVKAKDSEFYFNAKEGNYYKKIIDKLGDDAYIVTHEKLSTAQPVILDEFTAESFYDFLEYWPEYKYGQIKLNDKTATWDAVKGGSTRWKKMTSQHFHGNAIDLNVPFEPGSDEHLNFKHEALTIATAVGFNSFGFGNNVLHMDTRSESRWWIYNEGDKFDFLNDSVQSIVPLTSKAFRDLVYRAPGSGKLLDRAVAQLTRKRRIREVKNPIFERYFKENLKEQQISYPYNDEAEEALAVLLAQYRSKMHNEFVANTDNIPKKEREKINSKYEDIIDIFNSDHKMYKKFKKRVFKLAKNKITNVKKKPSGNIFSWYTDKVDDKIAGDSNIEENEQVFTSDLGAREISDIVVEEINAAFSNLPDNSPLKNREMALAAMKQIKNNLPSIIQGKNIE